MKKEKKFYPKNTKSIFRIFRQFKNKNLLLFFKENISESGSNIFEN